MILVDLDEVPELARRGLIKTKRFALGSFLRTDHLGDPSKPLIDAVRDYVQQQTGTRPAGPIRLATQLRTLGYYFSPINLFYCFDEGGKEVECIVAEVTNTPWNQMHAYILWSGNREGDKSRLTRYQDEKVLHVSPFMEMNYVYHWRVNDPGERLIVRLENWRDGACRFDATLSLYRRRLDRAHLRSLLWRYPVMPARIIAAIYFEALKLWAKRCPYQPHPDDKLTKPV